MKFASKEAKNSTSLPPFWTVLGSQATFSWCHSVQEILSKWLPTSLLTITLVYGYSWARLFWAKHAPNSENDSSEDSEVDNRLEKYILPTLWRMQNWSQVFLLAANFFESDGMMSHRTRPGCQVQFKMVASEVASFEANFFRTAGTSETKTSVSEKLNVYLL